MSVPVELSELRTKLSDHGSWGYLLTVGTDGRPHCVAVAIGWAGDLLALGPGNSSLANASARPLVSVLFPPREEGGYSLIIDGEVATATTGPDGNLVTVRPTKAVLHRPAGESAPAGTHDCVPVYRVPAV